MSTPTIERIGTLASVGGRMLRVDPADTAEKLKPGDILRLSWSRSVQLPGMPLRVGQLEVQRVSPNGLVVLVDVMIMKAIPAALAADTCDCPDTVYRVTQ
jgi:hypothetical protein